jgi:hypothetical protein
MSIVIEDYRKEVDASYVGISLTTGSIKPVHIANGLFRGLVEKTNSTKFLNRFVFHQNADGKIPRDHEINSVFADLETKALIDPSIDKDSITALRLQLKRIVSADNGVFIGDMSSYTAGNKAFISKDTIGQGAGVFFAGWLEHTKSPLREELKKCLENDNDIITQICTPLLVDEPTDYIRNAEFDDLKLFNKSTSQYHSAKWDGLESAAKTLASNLANYPDKLFRLRMIVLFSILVVMRHIVSLESYYVRSANSEPPPFLLNIDGKLNAASKQSYARCTGSISRFYGFAFGQRLKRDYTIAELMKVPPPKYKDGAKKKKDIGGKDIWEMYKEKTNEEKNKFTNFGNAVFDIIALEAEADPIRYFRSIGKKIGLVYPPKGVAIPWFSSQQDLIELLVHCCVAPSEKLELSELCTRLRNRFDVLIGNGETDEDILTTHNIDSWDRDSLRANRKAFADDLVLRGFGNELADGILKVSVKD